MKEQLIEEYLCKRVRTHGGIPYKFTSPNRRNVPDRICCFSGARVVFVECKATGKTTTDAQEREHDRLRALGHRVYVVDSMEAVDDVIHRTVAKR